MCVCSIIMLFFYPAVCELSSWVSSVVPVLVTSRYRFLISLFPSKHIAVGGAPNADG